MSSAAMLETVTPEWLTDRMGAARRWSTEALTKLLDAPVLARLAALWPALPTGQHAVVKHRVLLALLTIKTPFAEDVLAGARALVATALADSSADAQVSAGGAGGARLALPLPPTPLRPPRRSPTAHSHRARPRSW